MIQRIQTVFLLLSLIALGLFLYKPLISTDPLIYPAPIQGYNVTLSYNGWTYFLTLILAGTAFGLTLINIFLFKWREIQLLICLFASVFIMAAQAYVYYKWKTYIFPRDVLFTAWNALSGVALLGEILAYFFIRKDERLVKSLDRLR